MKIKSLITISTLWLTGCIGTDLVEDRLSAISLSAAGTEESISGSVARLVGETVTLEAWGTSDLGGSFLLESVSWSSSDPSIASVDDAGVVTALSVGTSRITASTLGIESDPVVISVAADLNTTALVRITTESSTTVINPGETLQLSGATLNAAGVEIEGNTITWSSSNEEVATVDDTGLVTGVADGQVRITATSGDISGFVDLFVGDVSSLTRIGSFEGLNGYRTSGEVSLVVNDEGNLTMVLADNFSAQNGPGLYFYLSNNRNSVSGGVEIGEVRSVSGADSYEVPDGVAFEDFNHVVLYCKPFGVGFGTAQLDN